MTTTKASEQGQLFAGLPDDAPEELLQDLLCREGFRLERIVSFGQASPEDFWYDQEQHEWVLLIRGRAGLEIEGEAVRALGPGDWVDIPAHVRHRVAWTAADEPTVWLAIHYDR
ncbi:MAG: cupin domain-containing protein [Acidobacteriota bacterium]